MKTLIIIRHGMTSANKEGRYCGHLDLPLIEEGMDVLEATKQYLQKENVGPIISSPLTRAVETSRFLFPDKEVIFEDNLKEINFGLFEGLSYGEIRSRYPEEQKAWCDDFLNYNFPEGESFNGFHKRIGGYVSQLLNNYLDTEDETIALCTHLGVIQYLLIHILKLDNSMLWRFKVSNGSFMKVGFDSSGYGYLIW